MALATHRGKQKTEHDRVKQQTLFNRPRAMHSTPLVSSESTTAFQFTGISEFRCITTTNDLI